MIILQEAARATDIAAILNRFIPYARDRRLIEAIERLHNLTDVLQSLARLITARGGRVEPLFRDDLELLQHSVAFTLQDVWIILGRLPEQLIGHDYTDAWRRISDNCRSRHSDSLAQRIQTYCSFAAALCRMLRSERVPSVNGLRQDVLDLRQDQLQNRRLITAADAINELSRLSITEALPPPSPGFVQPPPLAPIRQPRSSERVRPPDVRTMSPTDSNTSKDFAQPPPVPQPPPPQSPPTSFTSASQASSNDIESQHWIVGALREPPATFIPEDRESQQQITRCYVTDPRDGDGWPSPDDGYDQILKMKFPGRLKIMYYFRERDARAKVLCEWPEGRNRSLYACLPVTDLHSKRQGSCLHFCRPVAGSGGSVAWATFKFTHIELLILFHCSFLSLRSHDTSRRRQPRLEREVFDRDLRGEDQLFAGAIYDNGYRHCLRIYRDRATSVLRLEAAVLEGEMKDTPIWTAFITHHVTSPRWLGRHRNPGRGTIYLNDLKKYIFSSAYEPHIAASGQHVLEFEVPGDAVAFESAIARIGERYRQPTRRPT